MLRSRFECWFSINPLPGESSRSTQLKFFSLEVEISVKTLSSMPLNWRRPSMFS